MQSPFTNCIPPPTNVVIAYQLLRIPILNQLPFNGTERDSKPEEIAQALHLHLSNVTTHWETICGVKGFLAKFLFEKAQSCWNP